MASIVNNDVVLSSCRFHDALQLCRIALVGLKHPDPALAQMAVVDDIDSVNFGVWEVISPDAQGSAR